MPLRKKPTETHDYKKGYKKGFEDGVEKGHLEAQGEIEKLKEEKKAIESQLDAYAHTLAQYRRKWDMYMGFTIEEDGMGE